MRQVSYLYDDPEHPDRPTGHLESPDWTPDDRALLLALVSYELTLCPGCGEPKHLAWHSGMEGWYETEEWVCHACTAKDGHEVPYRIPQLDKDLPQRVLDDLEPFELGVTTTAPSPPDRT